VALGEATAALAEAMPALREAAAEDGEGDRWAECIFSVR